jgi:pyruvate-formate lyase
MQTDAAKVPNVEELQALEVQKNKESRALTSVANEMAFTVVHQSHASAPPFVRELACLRQQIPVMMAPLQEGDWFAGRHDRAFVGIDPERGDLVECAYYCRFEELRKQLQDPSVTDALRQDIGFLLEYWADRTTYTRCREAFPEHLRRGLPSDEYYRGREISFPMYGLGGPCLDYGKLVRLGIAGLRREVDASRARAEEQGEPTGFHDLLAGALDIFAGVARQYAAQARAFAASAAELATRARMGATVECLERIAEKAPRTYREAMQLAFLWAMVAQVKNYGRMDAYLGDFLARDLDSGAMTYDEAVEMTVGLWKLIEERKNYFNNRIIIGGRGRANAANADRFAMLALDVQGRTNQPSPQLSLRWHEGMPTEIWEKAVEVIGRGTTFPIVYNDDVTVPAVEKAFGVRPDEAEQWAMYGCGEYVIDHMSVGSPDAAINLAKAFEATLHNGFDPFFGEPRGLALGSFDSFATFEEFRDAVGKQLEHEIALLAEVQALITRVTGEHAAYPFLSLLYDDCIARGKPLLAGGVRYVGGTLEAFGSSTVADSLTAIKRVVFDRKLLTPQRLLECLRSNFGGCERERQMLLHCPKYGNDDAEADAMSLWVNECICKAAAEEGRKQGLDSFLVVLINNGDSILFGKTTSATPDGRPAGKPIANANQPGAGYDTSGLTALFRSMSKLDPSLHAGVVHNVKMSRQLFRSHQAEASALLRGYFAGGGTQAMISVTDRAELERALEHPEEYANLIVRVGGYSERFVNLPRDIQEEVMRRTLY